MSDEIDVLLDRVTTSSGRLRIAMGITAVLCLLLVAGLLTDSSLWNAGTGWRIAGFAGLTFFSGIAVLLLDAAFWRQRRHIARLRSILREQPQRIRSIRLLVARAVPVASWSPDGGSATRGLNVVVADESGANWVLPVSRAGADLLVAALTRRCPRAVVEP